MGSSQKSVNGSMVARIANFLNGYRLGLIWQWPIKQVGIQS